MNKKIAALCIITLASLTACNDKNESKNMSPSINNSKKLNHEARKKCMKTYQQNNRSYECLPATKPTNCDQATYASLKQQAEPICSKPEKNTSPYYLWLTNWKQCFKINKDSNNTTTWCLPTERQQNCPINTFKQLKETPHLSCSNKPLIPAPEWTQYPPSCFGNKPHSYLLTVCTLPSKPTDCDSGKWNKLQKDNGITVPSCPITNTFTVSVDQPSFKIRAIEAMDGGITAEDPIFDNNLIKYNKEDWVNTGGTMPGNPGGYNVFKFTATKKMLENKNQTYIQIDTSPGESTPIWINYYLVISNPKNNAVSQ
jgi:hypothetical protein